MAKPHARKRGVNTNNKGLVVIAQMAEGRGFGHQYIS
jgi:hypothetical protein